MKAKQNYTIIIRGREPINQISNLSRASAVSEIINFEAAGYKCILLRSRKYKEYETP